MSEDETTPARQGLFIFIACAALILLPAPVLQCYFAPSGFVLRYAVLSPFCGVILRRAVLFCVMQF